MSEEKWNSFTCNRLLQKISSGTQEWSIEYAQWYLNWKSKYGRIPRESRNVCQLHFIDRLQNQRNAGIDLHGEINCWKFTDESVRDKSLSWRRLTDSLDRKHLSKSAFDTNCASNWEFVTGL